jgi:hypothetical protein
VTTVPYLIEPLHLPAAIDYPAAGAFLEFAAHSDGQGRRQSVRRNTDGYRGASPWNAGGNRHMLAIESPVEPGLRYHGGWQNGWDDALYGK